MTITVLAGAAVFTALLVAIGCACASRWRLMLDVPGVRSLHDVATPRTGGVVVHGVLLLALLVAFALGASVPPISLVAGLVLVLAISVLDDIRDISPLARLAVHFIAAGLLVGMTWENGIWIAVAVTVFLVWGLNLFNFMDGMDGLAGTMAAVGAGGLAILGWLGGNPAFSMQALTIAAAAAGFLSHNLPPARLFMGDTGSAGLGYLLGAFSYLGVVRDLFPWQSAVLLFLPFLVDASLTLLLRLLRRRKVWQAHREHVYQRLVLNGWSVPKVLGVESFIMGFCALISIIVAREMVDADAALALTGVGLASLYFLAIHYTSKLKRG